MGRYEDLERLQKFKEDGILSEQEFQKEKQNLLNNTNYDIDNKSKKFAVKINNKTVKIFIITFIVAMVLIIVPAIIIPKIQYNIEKGKEVQVPNLIGKTLSGAKQELLDLGLNVQAKYPALYSDNPDSIIQSQDYKEGDMIKKGSTIEVIAKTQEQIDKEKKEQEERLKEQEEAKKNGYYKSSASTDTIISCAKTLISDSLKSSSTAIWGTSEIVDQDNYGRNMVYVSLEAQNGFGGYGKLNYFVILQEVEVDGYFTYLPYTYRYEIVSYVGNPYQYVTDYKEGNIIKPIQTFLENNNWNERKDKGTDKTNANTNTSDEETNNNEEKNKKEETSIITIGADYHCTTSGTEGYITFESDNSFKMELENEHIEKFTRRGTYTIDEDIIILTVLYDSTDVDSSNIYYIEEITVKEDGSLKYITEFDDTIIFDR